ncbi:MAG: tetratricopeptide repeat protein [Gammaproteobacteria bacterium]
MLIAQPVTAGRFEEGYAAFRAGDGARAIAHWSPLAEGGNVDAQVHIAYLYRRGVGVQADPERAFHWYRRAALQGSADARYELALMYELGIGTPADIDEAQYWYGLATEEACPGELSSSGGLVD